MPLAYCEPAEFESLSKSQPPQGDLRCLWAAASSPHCCVTQPQVPGELPVGCGCPAHAATWLDISSWSWQQKPWPCLPPLHGYHPVHPMPAPCWLQLHKEGLYIPIASFHTGHIFQTPSGDRAEDTVTILCSGPPSILKKALLGQVPTTAFEWLQISRPGLELTLTSDLYMCCRLDGVSSELFWAALSLSFQGKTPVSSKPETTPFIPAALAV